MKSRKNNFINPIYKILHLNSTHKKTVNDRKNDYFRHFWFKCTGRQKLLFQTGFHSRRLIQRVVSLCTSNFTYWWKFNCLLPFQSFSRLRSANVSTNIKTKTSLDSVQQKQPLFLHPLDTMTSHSCIR